MNSDVRFINKRRQSATIFIGVDIEAKKLLKRFAFSQKSELKLSSTNKGGIAGIFLL